MQTQTIRLTTADQIKIKGIFCNNDYTKAAILLHMMPATKESWKVFAVELNRADYASIAIDERGHGESTMGGTLDFNTFSDQQQQDKIFDVEAAFNFLLSNGFEEKNIVVVGASIGANLSIQFLAKHADVHTAVALSPGLNYRGVKTEEFIKELHANQRVVLIASNDDLDSITCVRTLHAYNPLQTILIEKDNLGHGTAIFENDPSMMKEIIALLQ